MHTREHEREMLFIGNENKVAAWVHKFWTKGRPPERLNFIRWHLTFTGPQYATSCMSPFGAFSIFENLCTPAFL